MTSEPAAAGAPAATPAVQQKPLDGIALAREVALDRAENLLEWLLMRLRRLRAKRGNRWE